MGAMLLMMKVEKKTVLQAGTFTQKLVLVFFARDPVTATNAGKGDTIKSQNG
jgi:hypothetical protein